MVFMNVCDICNKARKESDNNFSVLMCLSNHVSCGKECHVKAQERAVTEMMDNNRYLYYSVMGNKYALIRRSSGKIQLAELTDDDACVRDLTVSHNDLRIIVTFNEKDEKYTKMISYKCLATLNLHLPVVSLSSIYSVVPERICKYKTRFDKKRKKVFDICVYNNRCLRLLIIAAVKNEGFFKDLPHEIVRIIISWYLKTL